LSSLTLTQIRELEYRGAFGSRKPLAVSSKFETFLRPSRYKAAWGGRAGAKSWFFAQQLVLRCHDQTTRAICIREVQETLKDSCYQLIVDRISALNLEHMFELVPSQREIRHRENGSLIAFRGMHDYNEANIKSLEGFDIAWVEEAQTLKERSWTTLRPTIRKQNSEIWVSWNPRFETDAVDKFFRGQNPPPDAIVINVNCTDNPWFTPDSPLWKEREHDFMTDPDKAEHVWNGGYLLISEGAYYASLITAADREGRIGIVPYDPSSLVTTAWDIGIDDSMAIWCAQIVGLQVRVLNYYENTGKDLAHYAAWLRDQPYRYGEHLVPHDAGKRQFTEKGITTVSDLLRPMVSGPVRVIPNEGDIEPGIERVRRLIPRCWFDRDKTWSTGLKTLRNYSRKWDDDLQTFKPLPIHNWASHGADGFRTLANGLRKVDEKRPKLAYPKASGIA
jgi:phage terminase large subunit